MHSSISSISSSVKLACLVSSSLCGYCYYMLSYCWLFVDFCWPSLDMESISSKNSAFYSIMVSDYLCLDLIVCFQLLALKMSIRVSKLVEQLTICECSLSQAVDPMVYFPSLLLLFRTRYKIRSRLVCFFFYNIVPAKLDLILALRPVRMGQDLICFFTLELASEAGVAADCTFLVAAPSCYRAVVDSYLSF